MKSRQDQKESNDDRELSESLKALVGKPGSSVPSSYWGSLHLRTEERIDKGSSPGAISLSWALRVAIPGVVAILCFFIGLAYYVPDQREPAITSIVISLPDAALDSLFQHEALKERKLILEEFDGQSLFFSEEDVPGYLLETGRLHSLLLNDTEIQDLIMILRSREVISDREGT
jgi:hypothetical protein